MEVNLENLIKAEEILRKDVAQTRENSINLYNASSKCAIVPKATLHHLQERINSIPQDSSNFNLRKSFQETLENARSGLIEYKSNYCEISFWGVMIPFTLEEVLLATNNQYLDRLYIQKVCKAVSNPN